MRIFNTYIPPGYIVLAIIAIAVITGSFILSSEEVNEDTDLPTINVLSKDFSVYQGEKALIKVNFSDNVNVTKATLFYRKETESNWESVSILSKSFSLTIAEDETKNYHYYVTVDDSAGNGPVGDPSYDGSLFYVITVLKQSTSDENVTIERAVFIEDATATTCANCPETAAVIHAAYENQDYPFYYVSLVEDESSAAETRLSESGLNTYAYPTVYFDGGYKLLYGNKNAVDDFDATLQEAYERQAPKIQLTLKSEWNESRTELKNTLYIKNYEKTRYTGTIKIYITEIQSQWTDYTADPYHFAFLEFGLNQEVTVEAGENKSIEKIWSDSENTFNVVKENLWVIAVLFDDEKHTAFSKADSNENQFDAYYVDATTASRVSEGTLPPTIGIVRPKEYNHYILDKESNNRIASLPTYIIGKMTIQTEVESDLTVEKVTFEITGGRSNISSNDTQTPYEFLWDQFSFGKRTITVTVYDEQGRSNSDTIDVWAFIL